MSQPATHVLVCDGEPQILRALEAQVHLVPIEFDLLTAHRSGRSRFAA
jgi:hypothetical protein